MINIYDSIGLLSIKETKKTVVKHVYPITIRMALSKLAFHQLFIEMMKYSSFSRSLSFFTLLFFSAFDFFFFCWASSELGSCSYSALRALM